MVSERKLASVMGGKTTRACDNCIKRRARWYCPADDAFLCQSCDASVHSANPLARRHERVRLKTSSLKESSSSDNYFLDLESPVSISSVSVSVSAPSWHQGFTRKARTPRHGRKASKSPWDGDVIRKNPIHLVPEILSDENSHDEIEEEQLLYRVPILDPFVAQLCRNNHDMMENNATASETNSEFKVESKEMTLQDDVCNVTLNRFHEMQPSEMELAEFAADVESLLGKGLDDESFDMEGLGLLGVCSKEENENSSIECSMVSHGKVKIEDEGEIEVDTKTTCATTHHHQFDHTHHDIDINGDTFEFKFDYDSSINISGDNGVVIGDENNEKNKKKILLNLDYEGVLTAWADQRSPWTNGERPELDSWPDCMGNYMGIMNENVAIVDSGREARVLRYREKRRTRLFSKKIRYEVRKLNAEKRPRMKGRFVKRANFAATTTTTPNYPLVK